jgi:poly-gamma-glutamate synthesis protein (capsule biosynthesis protein)
MTGRGIDQVLPHPSDPVLYEPYTSSALAYVQLAEAAHGAIQRPVDFAYIWGEALVELEGRAPDARIINLETSVTTSSRAVPKGINYRMHPANVPCLLAAKVDCCVLANNHVMDWGVAGLLETLDTLAEAGIAVAGAGRTPADASKPATIELSSGGRVLVLAAGSPTSGIPRDWRASDPSPGLRIIDQVSGRGADALAAEMQAQRQPGDVVVVSIHWGGNWGYEIPWAHREFAHRLVEAGAADVVHGHSSHHAKGIEVYRERLILYGCGDFINDYEGIAGYEQYRSDLAVAHFATVDRSGRLERLEMVPFQSRRFRLERVTREDAQWLRDTLSREGRELGTGARLSAEGVMSLVW